MTPKKVTGLPIIFHFFNKVGTTFYFPTQGVSIVKTSDWVGWKGILISKIKKIQTQNFYYEFFLLIWIYSNQYDQKVALLNSSTVFSTVSDWDDNSNYTFKNHIETMREWSEKVPFWKL
jgi:hypothetical protein